MGITPDGLPQRFGPYTVLRKLGEGGMGHVYLARSPGGRLVAVKTVRDEYLQDPGFRKRFRVEARAARKVSGAFTAPVIDAEPGASIPWLATAFVDAPTLAEQVRAHGVLDGPALRRLAAGLAEALGSVHAAGILHRDLKPSNILMPANGPRLIDFGIAGALETPERARQGERPIGSPGYISPEQYAGENPTEAADVFSLGAVLCFAATGEGPFGSGPPEVLDVRVAELDPDLKAIGDPLIASIAGYCLARDPRARPGTQDVLEMLSDRRPQTVPAPTDTVVPTRKLRRKRRTAVGSGLGALTVGAALTLALVWPTGTGAAAFVWSLPSAGAGGPLGMWTGTDDIVVGTQSGGLAAYDAATGTQSWTWEPPSGDGLCAMSPSTSAGLGAIMYGPTALSGGGIICTDLQAISIPSGHLVWRTPIELSATKGTGPQPGDVRALSIDDGEVSAPYFAPADESTGQGPDAVADVLLASTTSGKTDWVTDHGSTALPDGCVMTGTAQLLGGVVYALGECGGQRTDLLSIGGSADSAVQDLGSVGTCGATSSGAGGGFLTADADYLLIGCPGAAYGAEIWSYHQGSSKPVRMNLPMGVTINLSTAGSLPAPGGILTSGDAVYLAASDAGSGAQSPAPTPSQSSSTPVELALDLATGRMLWSHPFPGASALVPLVTNGPSLQAVVANTSASAQLVTLQPSDGQPPRGQTASRLLSPSAGASFASSGVDLPYAAIVGPNIAVLFPQSLTSDGKSLAVLATE